MIIKKFKFLKLRHQQEQLEHGKLSKGKWTYAGYNPIPDANSERQQVSDLKWDQLNQFSYQGKQTLLQRYCMRTAAYH